jgi:hypothetical protein
MGQIVPTNGFSPEPKIKKGSVVGLKMNFARFSVLAQNEKKKSPFLEPETPKWVNPFFVVDCTLHFEMFVPLGAKPVD